VPRSARPRRQVLLAVARIGAATIVALVALLTVRTVAAGDTLEWNSQRPLTYGITDPQPPGPPEDVSATVDVTSITVRWLPPADEGSYEVTYYAVSSQPATQGCLAERVTECVITDVRPGTYTFRVQALNGAGWGPWSEPSAPLTLALPTPISLSITGQRVGSRLTVQITSTGLAAGTPVTVYTKSGGAPAFVPQRATLTIGPSGAAAWSTSWRDRRPVQFYAIAGGVRSPTARIR